MKKDKTPKKIHTNYDRIRDVFYAIRDARKETINLPVSDDEAVRIDPKSLELVGFVITNFKQNYPKLIPHLNPKEYWFVKAHFEQRIDDWNEFFLSRIHSKKALIDFLSGEHLKSTSPKFA